MRINLSFAGFGRLHGLNAKKLIIIVFLFRFILASMYDIFVHVNKYDILLPDSHFYTMNGRYAAFLFNLYDPLTEQPAILNDAERATYLEILRREGGRFPKIVDESKFFSYYVIGFIYFIFGYFPLAVRAFNIVLSIASAYLIYRVGRRQFGEMAANLFLVIALFLPTQVIYSITLTRDFLRMFIVAFIIWLIYGGDICLKKAKPS